MKHNGSMRSFEMLSAGLYITGRTVPSVRTSSRIS
nr:MAG TPA: hypothetical protein [Caudoviricetes sp.]DAS38269.1 MAG TPA: hypothetical protein [Caudoviricetes sp.]